MKDEIRHVFVSLAISSSNKNEIPSLALIDSVASSFGVSDTKFERDQSFELKILKYPRSLRVFDRMKSVTSKIFHAVRFGFDLEGHNKSFLFFVTTLTCFYLALGLLWLQIYSPEIQWNKKTLCFNQPNCQNHTSDKSPAEVTSILLEKVIEQRNRSITNRITEPFINTKYCNARDFEDSIRKR